MATKFTLIPGSTPSPVGTNGEIREPSTFLFNGDVSDLPTGQHGDFAFCFSGDTKGKVYIYDAEAAEWVEQE